MTAMLAGLALAGPACTDDAKAEAKKEAGTALDATKAGADKVLAATKKAGEAGADSAKDAAAATGVLVTDSWITTKVKAKIADEIVLERSDINVETTDRVVTLKGRVPSRAAQTRALEIARGTEGVARVVNQLVVKS
jgi:hyperosmotically inducible protein